MAGLVFSIEAQDKFSNTFKKAQTEIQKTGNVAGKTKDEISGLSKNFINLNNGIGGLAGSLTSIIPAIGGVSAVVTGLYKGLEYCTKAAMEAEVVQVRFATALKLTGANQQTITYLTNYAGELQNITGVSDEVIKSAMALGSTMGMNAIEIQKAIKVALDLSAALGFDLNTAMRMLAKGTEGNIEQLKRYIPSLGDLNLEAMNTAEILDIVGQKVEGMAEKMAETGTGSVNKMKESFGDLAEIIGTTFIPLIEAISEGLTVMAQSAVKALSFEKYKTGKQTNALLPTPGQEEIILINAAEVNKNTEKTKENTKAKEENTKKVKESTQAINYWEIYVKAITQAYEEVDEAIEKYKFHLENLSDAYEETTEVIDELKNYYHNAYKESTTTEEEEVSESAQEVAEGFDYLALASQALGVSLNAGLEGFLISLVTQTQAFGMLAQIMQPIISLLDTLLVPLLNMLLPPIMAIFNAMKPLFQILIIPLLTLGAVVSNLIAGLTAFATLVMYIVTFQWGKISGIKWTGTSLEQLIGSVQTAWANTANVSTGLTTTTTTTGTGASYSAAPTYHINVYITTAALVGEDGMDEFAMLIKQKIDFIVARGA